MFRSEPGCKNRSIKCRSKDAKRFKMIYLLTAKAATDVVLRKRRQLHISRQELFADRTGETSRKSGDSRQTTSVPDICQQENWGRDKGKFSNGGIVADQNFKWTGKATHVTFLSISQFGTLNGKRLTPERSTDCKRYLLKYISLFCM